jgi:ribosomal protein L37AE/L43A
MDWRNNQWIGLGAAGLLVVGIAILFWYTFGGETAVERQADEVFKCDACDVVFTLSMKELIENEELYNTYFGKYGEAVPCQQCGEVQAYKVYNCPQCEELYKYTAEHAWSGEVSRCPKGHDLVRGTGTDAGNPRRSTESEE